MTRRTRIKYILQGIIMLLSVPMMLYDAEFGYLAILAILVVTAFVYTINQLIYYFTLARYMVGGKLVLFKALVSLNLSFQLAYLTSVPKMYVMLYLVLGLVFGGIVDVLRALETRNREGIHWKIKMIQGLITICVSLIGLCFVSSSNIVVEFYCFGIVSSAVTKLSEAFRRTDIIYIG